MTEQEFKEYIRPFEERACRLALLPFEIRAAELALVPYEIRAGSWDESLHPRDSKGKFKAKNVQLFAGGGSSKNKLTNSGSGGTIKATNAQRKAFINDIKGTKTYNNIIINNVSAHAADRMLSRNIPSSVVKDVLITAQSAYPGTQPDTYCVQKNGIRIVYSDSGTIITAITL